MTNNATFNSPIKRKIASLDKRKARSGWFFILPFLIGFILIYLPIIFDSIKMSFTEIVPGTNNDRFFVWFDNYGEALFGYTAADKRTFLEVLIDGLLTLAFELPSILIFSLYGSYAEPEGRGTRTLPCHLLHSRYYFHGYYGADRRIEYEPNDG